MPILCEECGSNMSPNRDLDLIECPKCGNWMREEWVLVYALVLELERKMETLNQVNELERRLKILERKVVVLEYIDERKGEF